MKIPDHYRTVYDEDITKEADGTFTASLEPWFSEPIKGIPTYELAYQFLYAAHRAMDDYSSNAMMDYG